ncbi:MAG: hypothetical protein LQ339_006980 [Xanthoria mediterranea]|nr:MAG: hypothetical protein LQ339_006980 [Xanthoria mediterranea]
MDDSIEMVLCTLGFKVLSMRSAHSATVRDECVDAFTSTGNIEDVQMLCTSTRIASTAVNLQADCSDVVFLDIPNNAQTLLQAGARVHRMGQKYPCHLYILTVDGPYDQSAQANQALKIRPIIAGQAGIADPTPEQCDQFRHTHPEVAGIKGARRRNNCSDGRIGSKLETLHQPFRPAYQYGNYQSGPRGYGGGYRPVVRHASPSLTSIQSHKRPVETAFRGFKKWRSKASGSFNLK